MQSTNFLNLPGSAAYLPFDRSNRYPRHLVGRSDHRYPDPPSITSFASFAPEADDASGAGNEASKLSRLLIIGASPMVYYGKTLDHSYITSLAHTVAESRPSGVCSTQHFEIPPRVLSTLVKNTLENLRESEWNLIKDNSRQGLSAFTAALRVSVESYANNWPRTDPPARDQTARSSNVCLHSGFHPLPMDAIHFQPSWRWDNPPSKPSVVLVTGTQGTPDSLAHISVILPFSVEYPEDPHQGGDSAHIKLTGTKEFCREVVSGMKSLEPVLQSVVGPWIRGEDGVTAGDVEDAVEEALERYFDYYIRYRSGPGDYRKINSSNAGDMISDPDWRIGNNEDESMIRVSFQPGAEQISLPTALPSPVPSSCMSASRR